MPHDIRNARLRDTCYAMLRAAALALVAGCLASCAVAPVADAGPPRIWDVSAQRFVDESTLDARLVAARYRLLGEVHDNPAHHRLRARTIAAIAAGGRRPAVVMEQLDFGVEGALQEAQRRGADADAVATAAGLDRSSWAWPLHRPIVAAALKAKLPLYPGNAPRRALDALMRTGDASSVDARWRTRLEHAVWTDVQANELAEEIMGSHCGKLPASVVPRLALAQRVRDAAMADALVRAATADGAILIAGNGHVRGDLGVPVYLDDSAAAVKVAWVEVGPAELRSTDAPAAALADHPGFDYLWLTGRVEREDPCRGMPEIPPSRRPANAPGPSARFASEAYPPT